MFTLNHFIWLAICSALIITLSIVTLKLKFSFKVPAFIMFGIALASEIHKILTNIVPGANGYIISPTAIPLHLCSIMVFAYLLFPFLKDGKFKTTLMNFTAVIGLIGPLCALLIPTEGVGFTNSSTTYQYFIYHAGMIYFSIYLIFSGYANLKLKAYISNIIITFSLAVLMIWVNSAMSVYDTNFFFIVRPPMENLPLLNLNNGWHAYFFTLVAIGFVAVTIVHLPSLIKQIVDNKKLKNNK